MLSLRMFERGCMLLLADTRRDLGMLKAKQRGKGRSLSHAHVSIDRAGMHACNAKVCTAWRQEKHKNTLLTIP